MDLIFHFGIGTPLKCPDKEDCLVVRVYPEWITRDGVPKQTIYGESLLVYFKKAGYFGFYAHLKKYFGRQGRIFNYKDVMALSGNSGSLSQELIYILQSSETRIVQMESLMKK